MSLSRNLKALFRHAGEKKELTSSVLGSMTPQRGRKVSSPLPRAIQAVRPTSPIFSKLHTAIATTIVFHSVPTATVVYLKRRSQYARDDAVLQGLRKDFRASPNGIDEDMDMIYNSRRFFSPWLRSHTIPTR